MLRSDPLDTRLLYRRTTPARCCQFYSDAWTRLGSIWEYQSRCYQLYNPMQDIVKHAVSVIEIHVMNVKNISTIISTTGSIHQPFDPFGTNC